MIFALLFVVSASRIKAENRLPNQEESALINEAKSKKLFKAPEPTNDPINDIIFDEDDELPEYSNENGNSNQQKIENSTNINSETELNNKSTEQTEITSHPVENTPEVPPELNETTQTLITEEQTIIKEEETPIKEESSTIEDTIVKEEETITKEENSTVEEEIVKNEESLVKEEKTITKEEETIVKEEKTIIKEENSTIKEEIVKEEEKIVKSEESLVKEEETITKEEETIIKEEETTFEEEIVKESQETKTEKVSETEDSDPNTKILCNDNTNFVDKSEVKTQDGSDDFEFNGDDDEDEISLDPMLDMNDEEEDGDNAKEQSTAQTESVKIDDDPPTKIVKVAKFSIVKLSKDEVSGKGGDSIIVTISDNTSALVFGRYGENNIVSGKKENENQASFPVPRIPAGIYEFSISFDRKKWCSPVKILVLDEESKIPKIILGIFLIFLLIFVALTAKFLWAKGKRRRKLERMRHRKVSPLVMNTVDHEPKLKRRTHTNNIL